MSPVEFTVVTALGIATGGYVGVAVDRYRRRRPANEYPRRYVSDVRMDRLHVIQDELVNPRGKEDE